jgi:acyl carrier protein
VTDEEILHVIRNSLRATDPERAAHYEGLTANWTLDDLGCDSVTVIEMIGEVERAAGVEISDDTLLDVRSISDLIKLVAHIDR